MQARSALHSLEVLITQALIDSNISHNESFLLNNVLKGFYDIKEEKISLYIKQSYLIVWGEEQIQKIKIQGL